MMPHSTSSLSGLSFRRLLLAGVSALTLLAAQAGTARAGNALVRANQALGGGVSGASASISAPQNAQAQANAAAVQSRNALVRANQALKNARDAQAAARAASAVVANGLGIGGLNPGGGAAISVDGAGVDLSGTTADTWQGVSSVTQTADDRETGVTVHQSRSKAILTWQEFNVGKETTLVFDQQGNASWVALNKVEASTAPSQILGTLKADGQVYVINRNGIIFGGTSQVNVASLVASSLPINDALFRNDILYSNPDRKFTFSAYSETAGESTDAFVAPAATEMSQTSKVKVEKGGQIAAAGGFVLLVGPEVENAGTLSAANGQVILAAGQQVAVLPHDSEDASLRGLDVYIGSVHAPAVGGDSPDLGSEDRAVKTGTTTNSGVIETERGAITMAGARVRQNGILHATTSVSLNGRIDLLAVYGTTTVTDGEGGDARFIRKETGLVQLGADSLTEILPELESKEKVAGTELALKSQVNISGQAVHLDRDATILAPSGKVAVQAGNYKQVGTGGNARDVFSFDEGQIHLDEGASIQVFGSIATGNAADNIIAVELRGAELADSPLQRNGALHGQTVYVDIRQTGVREDGTVWYGTPLADATGYIGLIQRTVGELTTDAGSVTLNAGRSVVMREGSWLNVSNGWIDYQGGWGRTTKLRGADGRIYDISQATPDREYVGIAGTFVRDHARWGVTETWTSALIDREVYIPGYIHGGAGGSASVRASALAFGGEVRGAVIGGERQRTVAPKASSLELLVKVPANAANTEFIAPPVDVSQSVTIGGASAAAPGLFVEGSYTLDPLVPIHLSSDLLSKEGVGRLTVDAGNGDIRILSAIEGPEKGELNLTGRNVTFEADVTLAGGTITAKAEHLPPRMDNPSTHWNLGSENLDNKPTLDMLDGRGFVTVKEDVTLSTAGRLVSDDTSALAFDGGSISLTGYRTIISEGSLLDVSGGASISATGKQKGGKGGSIVISAGQPGVDGSGTQLSDVDPRWGLGRLVLAGELRGYGVLAAGASARGGSLTIKGPSTENNIGDSLLIGGDQAPTGPNALWLQPDFFSQGGFASFSLSSIGKETIAPGTVIDPVISSYKLISGGGGPGVERVTLDNPYQRAPFSLKLSADSFSIAGNPVVEGDLTLGEGAAIHARPTLGGIGAVSLKATRATILGSILAPGGSIAIASKSSIAYTTTMTIGPKSELSAAGAMIPTVNRWGYNTGTVLDGGSIEIGGNFLIEEEAVLNVSGVSAVLDVPAQVQAASFGGKGSYAPLRIDGDAGAITLDGGANILSLGTLKGGAEGSGQGGRLTVSALADNNRAGDEHQGISLNVVQGLADMMGGGAWFAADSFNQGGFDTLEIKNSVRFLGSVTINAPGSILIGDGSLNNGGVIAAANAAVTLNAVHVSLGYSYESLFNGRDPTKVVSPENLGGSSGGTGTLTVNAAELIDVGLVATQGIGRVALNTSDLRGYGTLEATGEIVVTADQVYPVTGRTFTIAALNPAGKSGSVTFVLPEKPQMRPLPFSAGGTLNVFAEKITQNGVLRAPFGQINLGSTANAVDGYTIAPTKDLVLGRGGVTSVTGAGLTLPYGVTLSNGETWIDPNGIDITADGPVQKAINLSGDEVHVREGALLDLSGGGDLAAYEWVSGLGGSRDVLASSASFAVLPSYQADYAPLVSMAEVEKPTDGSASRQSGWSGAFAVGDRVWLDGAKGLAAGWYVLLPARYALLKGAFLVTPQKGEVRHGATLSVARPDGSSIVSGRRANALTGTFDPLPSLFEVASAEVVQQRARYDVSSASEDLPALALALDAVPSRMPIDAGQLIFRATSAMSIRGSLRMEVPEGGRGGLVDIGSSSDIVINDTGSGSGALYLKAGDLSGFGAESLLVGGVRHSTQDGGAVEVTSDNVTLANSEENILSRPEIILVARDTLTLEDDSVIEQRGTLSGAAETLLFGDAATSGSGNGALVRVSSATGARIGRRGVTPGTSGDLVVGKVRLSGAGVILDSTGSGSSIDSGLDLEAGALTLGGGRINLQFDDPGTLLSDSGNIVLSSATVADIQRQVGKLTLQSYSSIDFYGHGTIGALDGEGRPTVESLSLSAAALRGFNAGAQGVTIRVRTVSIDNLAGNVEDGKTLRQTGATAAGPFVLDAERIEIGGGSADISGYESTVLSARNGVSVSGKGGLSAQGDITVRAPVITAATAAEQALEAGGRLAVLPYGGGAAQIQSGLGGKLALTGQTVEIASRVYLPSGALTVKAEDGIVVAGGGELNVSGVAMVYSDQIRYTNAGSVTLETEAGAVEVKDGGAIDVSASSYAGDAGTLTVRAAGAGGAFTVTGALRGAAANGTGGRFSLDVQGLASLGALNAALNQGGFTQGRSFRARTGNVLVEGQGNRAKTFVVSADAGKVTVSGRIDASGETGGRIELYGHEGVTLENGAVLTVAAEAFDSAGKGGSVLIEAGGTRLTGGELKAGPGWIDVAAGALIDLSVAGGTGGTLHLRAPQVDAAGNPIGTQTVMTGTIHAGEDLAIRPLAGEIRNASSIVAEGFQIFDLTANGTGGGQIDTNARNAVKANGQTFAANWNTIITRLLPGNPGLASVFHLRPGAELAVKAGDITLPPSGTTGAGNWDLSTYRTGPLAGLSPGSGEPGILTIRAPGNVILQAAISDGFAAANIVNPSGYGYPYDNLGYYRETTGAIQATAYPIWQWVLLPAGSQSWSYRITAGADLGSVRHGDVLPLSQLADADSGSVQLGVPATQVDRNNTPLNPTLTRAEYQTIRTGTGDIDIAAARDVKLLNQFATIYTAGSQVADSQGTATAITSGGHIDLSAGLSLQLPNSRALTAPESVTIVSDQDGYITRTVLIGAVDAKNNTTLQNNTQLNVKAMAEVTELSVGTIIVLPGGTEGLPHGVETASSGGQQGVPLNGHSGGMPYLLAADNIITVAAQDGGYGANISFTNGGSIAGIKSGTTIILEKLRTSPTAFPTLDTNLGYLTANSGGTMTVYGNNVTSQSVTMSFAAGQPLPTISVPAGSTAVSRVALRFDNDATITSSAAASFAGIPSGTYTTSSAAVNATQVYLPANSRITVVSAGGGIRTAINSVAATGTVGNAYIPVTIYQPFTAGTSMAVDPGSSVTLTAAGKVTFTRSDNQNITVLQPFTSGSNLYAFDRPNTAYALMLSNNSPGGGSAINSNWFGSLGGEGTSGGLFVPLYVPQWSNGGGNVTITAGNDIIHQAKVSGSWADDAQSQLPNNWLYRRGATENGKFVSGGNGDMASTAWWVDFSNFFEGVGALGGGNVALTAGRDVKNVDAVAPTNAWMPYQTLTLGADGSVIAVDDKAANQPLFEYGGGNVTVLAGRDINAGVYYVERGDGVLGAGRDITTNDRRVALFRNGVRETSTDPADWLPTQLMLGKGDLTIDAGRDARIGAVTNLFLLPQGIQNSFYNRAYFLTYDEDNRVDVSALTGSVTVKGYLAAGSGSAAANRGGTLVQYFQNVLAFPHSTTNPGLNTGYSGSIRRSWLRLAQTKDTLDDNQFRIATSLMPANLALTAFTGDVNIVGAINLAPAPEGGLGILAGGAVNGFMASGNSGFPASINVSDADPSLLPGINSPLAIYAEGLARRLTARKAPSFGGLNRLFDESGATRGADASAQARANLHASGILHSGDDEPVFIYAGEGDISGLALYSPKETRVIAGRDIGDVALYLQNLDQDDVSMVAAGRDIVAYNENTPARRATGSNYSDVQDSRVGPLSGDIVISGPGTLEILAGRNLDLGGKTVNTVQGGRNDAAGKALGVISLGNQRNPYLSNAGADIVMMAGAGAAGLENGSADLTAFAALYLDPANLADPALALDGQPGKVAKTYEAELFAWLSRRGYAGTAEDASAHFNTLSADERSAFLWTVYFEELRQGGREYNDAGSRRYQSYLRGRRAIAALFGESEGRGDIDLSQRRMVRSDAGGSIVMLAPHGAVNVGITRGGKVNPLDEGVMTLRGGDISIYAKGSVEVGDSRIFTFQGGDILIWSAEGNIAAGHGSKTLQAAPPARFLIDPATGAAVQDISGVATGSGIGTLQTLAGVPPGDVDLIAPRGYIDAGDAGIRVSGDINLVALQVLNAANIQVQGNSAGVPVAVAPNVGALTAASGAAGQAAGAADAAARSSRQGGPRQNDLPSIITVEVIGYGGVGGGDEGTRQQQRLQEQERQRHLREQRSYDDRSPFQIVGAGVLNELGERDLTKEEKQALRQP